MSRRARLVFGIGLVAPVVAALVWLASDRRSSPGAFDDYSALNRSKNGVSIAYEYLRSRRSSTSFLRERIDSTKIESNAVVFRIAPSISPVVPFQFEDGKTRPDGKGKKKKSKTKTTKLYPILTQHEEEWLQRGGRLVLAIRVPYAAVQVIGSKAGRLERVFPSLPDLRNLSTPEGRVLAGPALRHAHAVYLLDGKPAIARARVGAGELFLLATPELFRNDSLDGDALRLVEALAPPDRPVYFDESVHGVISERGIGWLLIDRWKLGPLLFFLVAAALLAFWRGASHVGPPERLERETRSEAIDLVAALGELYDQALPREEALQHYHRSFVRAVTLQTGLHGDALQQRVREWTEGWSSKRVPFGMSKDDFQRQLTILNNAYRRLEHGKSK